MSLSNSERVAIAGVALAALALALYATAPSHLVNLNWDNGGYVADMATWRYAYLARPWSAHFAIAPIYTLCAWVAVRVFNGTIFDGLRLATTIAFVLAASLLADLMARITRNALVTFGLGALFVTMWVNQFLLLTIEDNVLYVPLLVLLFRVAFFRSHALRRRDALLLGAIAGLAALLSLQALLYLFPALGLCLMATPAHDDEISPRLGAVGLCILGAAGAIVTTLLVMAIGRPQLRTLFDVLLAPPNPPLAMRSPLNWHASLDALGWAAGHLITHTGYDPALNRIPRPLLGALFLTAIAVYCGVLLWVARRRQSLLLALVACTLMLLSIATPLRVDTGYAYLKRFDFLPACLVLSIALLVGLRARGIMIGVLTIGLAITQLALGMHWANTRRASYGTLSCPLPAEHPSNTWYGRDGKSWVAYFRDLRVAHPDACVFLFDLDELSEGRWWQEVPGALWSELPNHVALGHKSAVQLWRYPPHVADPHLTDDPMWHESCAVTTCAAARRLASP